jgi:hypothetical protein
MENEVCENCGRAIGKLEQAFIYKGHVVCRQCNKHLCGEPSKTQSHPENRNMAKSLIFLTTLVFWSLFCLLLVVSAATYYEYIRETSEYAYDAPMTKIVAITAIVGKTAKGWFLIPLLIWYLDALPLFIGLMLVKKDKKETS